MVIFIGSRPQFKEKMFEVKVLTTSDRESWYQILADAKFEDVNWLPQYLEIFETESSPSAFSNFGGQGTLFYYGDRANFVFYPFFKRKLSDLPFADHNMDALYDIVSPYGYGGPIIHLEDVNLAESTWRGFFSSFEDYCVRQKIVSEFCRLHPIYENHKPLLAFSQGVVEKLGQICYVDLSQSIETILKSMIHGHRRHIRRALDNHDLTFESHKYPADPRNFYELYEATMQRHDAQAKYFFSEEFFERSFRNLGNSLKYCSIKYRAQAITSWIVLHRGDLAYAWLSGAKEEYFNLFGTNLLVYNTIRKLKEEGCKILILGGGKSVSKDSVFAFKVGFSPLLKDYYVYKKIHLPREYDQLIARQGLPASALSGFFPAYRQYEEMNTQSEIELPHKEISDHDKQG